MGIRRAQMILLVLISVSLPVQARMLEEAGVAIEVPSGWEVFQKGNGDIIMALRKPMPLLPFNPGTVIMRLPLLPKPQTREELRDTVESMAQTTKRVENVSNYQIVSSRMDKKSRLGGFSYKATYELSHVADEKRREVVNVNHLFFYKGLNFAVSLIAPQNGFKEYDKALKKVLKTIDVVPPH